ncbi:hypothetical protein ATK17_0003 [Branchiibius hedensis]|uniref:Uncharacterized protein n=1 Tax=Branchiibius hedensis TaxID=672460 RepID=A0A2Y8ZK27_9MICO|nr:hypothetical protein [Branchiibius hedensis]PWJ22806.1 hypothetical protein ATK17_3975 [Branchiibius hedensis]PWJ23922.1 hypothetical protein ATK17_0003 [Branchiibius hedensis]SSA32740.1 hypothetical protein SAMN04489750_0003 [Branchiibius hedensis]SSA59155.1 hypothetical protein SAMN04489750_3975 [Branchiibius hedensis]
MDLTTTIEPKSDQLNADDLMAGPRTVTITEVRKGSNEQPVNVVTAEFGPGRPYKPSKSMRRVMVAAWGVDSAAYLGRRMTIYRDPKIRFGPDEVGGIRISHLSHIDKPLTMALTVSKGKRTPYRVQPLADAPAPDPDRIGQDQMRDLIAAFDAVGITERADRSRYVTDTLGREVAAADMTRAQADTVIAALLALVEPAADAAELPIGGE